MPTTPAPDLWDGVMIRQHRHIWGDDRSWGTLGEG